MRTAFVLLVLAAAPAAAQQPRTIDRIVAIVGIRPILWSQIEEQLVRLQAQGTPVPTNPAQLAALRRQLLDQMIDEYMLVQQAERDTTIKVTEQEVVAQVEQSFQNVRREFTTETAFLSQLAQAGFASAEEWRRYLTEQQRRAIQQQRLIESLRQQGVLRPIPPSDSAMRAFFEENRSQLPPRPPIVSFRQIVLDARADSGARLRALRLADSLVGELRRGADFAALAKRVSDDSTTRESGGELGWFRRGVMVKPFEAAAFALKPGEISAPVESQYGFHIIRVDRIQPAEILARHILIVPQLSAEQVVRARHLADSIRAALASGAPFDQLAQRYSDPLEPRLTEDVPISQLPGDYQAAIESDSSLGLRPVLEMGAGNRVRFVILDILKRQAAGPVEFEDVKARIRARLGDQLALDHYLKRMRRETYVDIRL